MSSTRGRTILIVVILLACLLLALGNMLCHALVVEELTGSTPSPDPGILSGVIHTVGESLGKWPQFVWFFTAAPLVVGVVLALLVGLQRGGADSRTSAKESAVGDPSTRGALRLLALLQQEGRLIDFLEEDIGPYADAQVGAAVRAIHAGCRKALHERMRIERIFEQQDGAPIEVPAGFDAGQVRLTGNVHGRPPFSGTLQHGGWRAAEVALPTGAGIDPSVLAPAEVEVS